MCMYVSLSYMLLIKRVIHVQSANNDKCTIFSTILSIEQIGSHRIFSWIFAKFYILSQPMVATYE